MSDWLPGVVAGECPPPSSRRRSRPRPWPRLLHNVQHGPGKVRPPGGGRLRRPRLLQSSRLGRDPAPELGRKLRVQLGQDPGGSALDGRRYMSYGGEVIRQFSTPPRPDARRTPPLSGRPSPTSSRVQPETAEDVPNYVSSLSVGPRTSRAPSDPPPQAQLEGDPTYWLGTAVRRIRPRRVGGYRSPQVPAPNCTLFELRSPPSPWTTPQTAFFTVTGYGHGVGMSQYGANCYGRGRRRLCGDTLPLLPQAELTCNTNI